MTLTDVSSRLRKGILQNDPPLVKRILKTNPKLLQNTDLADKSNTSLHLAAQQGFLEISEHLVELGHDRLDPPGDYLYQHSLTNQGPSYNTDGHVPLHLAASHSRDGVVELLCDHFPRLINQQDNEGATPLHLAARGHPTPSAQNPTYGTNTVRKAAEDTTTIETLLLHGADVHAQDRKGDTCLHYANAWGNLKAMRVLIQNGADPLARNHGGWTPEFYSLTVQAEVYYKNLVAEFEKRRAQDDIARNERKARSAAGVRLVNADQDDAGELSSVDSDARDRADSGGSRMTTASKSSGLGVTIGRVDSWR